MPRKVFILRHGPRAINKIPPDKYRKSHCGDKMIVPPQWDSILRWHLHIESGSRISLSSLAYSWWHTTIHFDLPFSGIDSSFFNSWQTQALCTEWPLPPTCKLTHCFDAQAFGRTQIGLKWYLFCGKSGYFLMKSSKWLKEKIYDYSYRMIRFRLYLIIIFNNDWNNFHSHFTSSFPSSSIKSQLGKSNLRLQTWWWWCSVTAETEMSFWQLPLQRVMKIKSKLLFCFNGHSHCYLFELTITVVLEQRSRMLPAR